LHRFEEYSGDQEKESCLLFATLFGRDGMPVAYVDVEELIIRLTYSDDTIPNLDVVVVMSSQQFSAPSRGIR